jgi:hypothetical protein
MANKMGSYLEHVVVDDLDGNVPAQSIKFGFSGVQYEIDLCKENEQRLRDIFAEFIPCARKIPRTRLKTQVVKKNPVKSNAK